MKKLTKADIVISEMKHGVEPGLTIFSGSNSTRVNLKPEVTINLPINTLYGPHLTFDGLMRNFSETE